MQLYITEGNGKKRKAKEATCLECGEVFLARATWVDQDKVKFCGVKCRAASKVTKVSISCDLCGVAFQRTPSKLSNSKSGKNFCSRECKDTAQSVDGGVMEIMPSHYGNGRRVYRARAFKEYAHKCADCGYDKYKRILQVHHIDNDREHNEVSNLVILCPTCHNTRHYVNEDTKID